MSRVIFEKEPQQYVMKLASALKNIPEYEIPEWALFVKTGGDKMRPPVDENFWFIRTASILRQIYIKGVVGVNRLRTKYGGRKNRGAKPAEFRKASGKIIRLILQQSEKAGFVEKVTGRQFGRRLTQKGKDFLDSIEVETKQIEFLQFIDKHKELNIEQEVEEEFDNGEETQQEE